MGIKTLTIIFILFAWSRIALRVKKGNARMLELLFWTIIWFAVGFTAIYPGTTDIMARILGVGRGFDAAVFFAILILLYSVYRIYFKISLLQQEITRLTRELAFKDAEKK
ncbi:MAG: hypothetical protein BWY68_00842 [bacterium ADurb.Bin400]|nr:MAG: hypothetical protein BWY68_00842 [bacterium ADurb.Bin400]